MAYVFIPLQGLRILDISRVLAGPYCTMLLGDYGADVIKVEIPGHGDDIRQWGLPWAGGESAYYLSVNRNKRGITVNLKHLDGQAIIRKLAMTADVLVENFEVGVLTRFAANPARVEHRLELTEKLSALFAGRKREEWLRLLEQAKVPHGGINTVPQALAHPQAVARGMVQSVPHPTAGKVSLVESLVKLSSTPARIGRHPSLLGEHTEEVLHELGFDADQVACLHEVGAI